MKEIPENEKALRVNKGGEIVYSGEFADKTAYLLYLRHLFVYERASAMIPEGSRILEVGCGDGYGAAFLANCGRRFEIRAVDVNEAAIERIRQNISVEHCEFSVYDGFTLPFEDGTYDAIISYQVIEHIDDDLGFLREISRVLKDDGIFLITTPNRAHRLHTGQKPWNSHHIREYFTDELKGLLGKVFANVEAFGVFGNGEIQACEFDRVAKLRDRNKASKKAMAHTVDIAAKLVPGAIRRGIKRMIKKDAPDPGVKQAPSQEKAFIDDYSTADYRLGSSGLEDSLDIFCRAAKK